MRGTRSMTAPGPPSWYRVRGGLYQVRVGGLLVSIERARGGWWVKTCGVVHTRYETLAEAWATL